MSAEMKPVRSLFFCDGVGRKVPACGISENSYFSYMIAVSATEGANSFHRLLELVERGETVRITKHGRVRAKIVRDVDFMDGKEFAKIFKNYKATELDKAAADEIEKNIKRIRREAERDLDH
jgi:hypothetical protein